jgi:hypothetical protein
MSSFSIIVDALAGGLVSHRFLEIPVSGPGKANRLVTITGVAVPDADQLLGNPTGDSKYLIQGDIVIKTDYRLKDADKWEGILDGNQTLLAATYVSLASVTYDDEEDITNPLSAPAFTAAVDSVDTTVDVDDGNRIQVHLVVGLQGDTTIHRISYQANILVQKAG